MEEPLKYGEDAIVADLNAEDILQPGVSARDFPAAILVAQLAVVREAVVAGTLPVGKDQLCVQTLPEHPQGIGVVALIGSDAPQMRVQRVAGIPRHLTCLSIPSVNWHLSISAELSSTPARTHRPSTTKMRFVTFLKRVLPTAEPAPNAVINVASRKVPSQPGNRRSSSSSFPQAGYRTPWSFHICNRRQQVEASEYSGGISRNLVSECRIRRILSGHGGSRSRVEHVHAFPASTPEIVQQVPLLVLYSATLSLLMPHGEAQQTSCLSVSLTLEAVHLYLASLWVYASWLPLFDFNFLFR
jgi:hypothetical protein